MHHRCIINCHQSFSCHFIFPKTFKRWLFEDHLSNASLEYFYVVRKKVVNLLVYISFDKTFSTVRHVKVYLNVPLHVILHLLGIFVGPYFMVACILSWVILNYSGFNTLAKDRKKTALISPYLLQEHNPELTPVKQLFWPSPYESGASDSDAWLCSYFVTIDSNIFFVKQEGFLKLKV